VLGSVGGGIGAITPSEKVSGKEGKIPDKKEVEKTPVTPEEEKAIPVVEKEEIVAEKEAVQGARVEIPELTSDKHSFSYGEEVKTAENKEETIQALKDEYERRTNSPEMKKLDERARKGDSDAINELIQLGTVNQRYRQAYETAEGTLVDPLQKEKKEKFKEEAKKIKKIKSFKTDEGQFDVYDIDKEHRRADLFTVERNKDGFIVRNVLLPENMKRKGIATEIYKKINEESLKITGKPLRSTPERILRTGERVHELSKDAIALWDSFVKSGIAIKISEKSYEFKAQEKSADPFIEEAKKYKTAEEFVESQGDVLYHASPVAKNIKSIKFQKGKTGELGEGFYFTENKDLAGNFLKATNPSKITKDSGVVEIPTTSNNPLTVSQTGTNPYLE